MSANNSQQTTEQNAFKYMAVVVAIFVVMVGGWMVYFMQRGADGRVLAQSALTHLRENGQSVPAEGLACHEILQVPLPEKLSSCIIKPTEPPHAEVIWQDGRQATVRALQ